MKKSKIAIIYSTNKYTDFIEQYNEKLLENTFNHYNVEIFPIKNYGDFSLTKAYNIGIEKVKEFTNNNLDEWIIVLCHHDIRILSKHWDKILLQQFNYNSDLAIAGIAGSSQLINGCWWTDINGQMNTYKLQGHAFHSDGLKTWKSVYGNNKKILSDVIVLDGVFLCCNPNNIKHWFDEDFDDYHFYDVSWTFQNYIEGCRISVINNIDILHYSIGETNNTWEKNRLMFLEKYKNKLPIELEK